MEVLIFILVLISALICEWIDSSLGMGYGTILSPLLIVFGFSPLLVVPSILITQALGGLSASIFHHKNGNANFTIKEKISDDMKTVLIITSLGVFAVIFGAFIASSVSKTLLGTYIAVLVLIMGFLILTNFRFGYSNGKMILVGIVSAFNKGLSGGGYGPIVTGSQIVLGKSHKNAVACTTAAEPLICLAGFITYLLINGISDYSLLVSLGIGAIIAGPIGAMTTKNLNKERLKKIIGTIMIFLGLLAILKILGVLSLNISM